MANPQLGDGQRKGVVGHSPPGLPNVYVLKQDGGQCRLFKRRDNVDALGSYSHVGEAPCLSRRRAGRARRFTGRRAPF
ncbi:MULTISPECIES: hypothetical protein [unclassified Janthinobacterium]|uniref:hypothetical protein n=1 Tax=unclassified Janthinobacterium TaxID=2610881 RepID=UPI00034BE3D3|nr:MULTISPECIES: hypothetical protein [unclassified Janthinobacterium]MEC5159854.1 hypothetical protein [Janthinobacterium sp. CG_S6]